MANTITITDDIAESGGVTTIVVEDYAPNPVTDVDDITFTDGGDLSAYPLEISKIGKGDNEEDTFRFDLWGFDDGFTVSIKSEGRDASGGAGGGQLKGWRSGENHGSRCPSFAV